MLRRASPTSVPERDRSDRLHVEGGGHVWLGDATSGTGADGAGGIVGADSMDIDNTDAIWKFFSHQSK